MEKAGHFGNRKETNAIPIFPCAQKLFCLQQAFACRGVCKAPPTSRETPCSSLQRASRSQRASAPSPAPSATRAAPPGPAGNPRLLPFRRKKDMAGPGSGRRARGDCRGEGPAPLIQQPARTSGCTAASTLARKAPLLPGAGPAAFWRCPGSACRHVIDKPPAWSSGPSPREASREACAGHAPDTPLRPWGRGRARPDHVTLRLRSALWAASDPLRLTPKPAGGNLSPVLSFTASGA